MRLTVILILKKQQKKPEKTTNQLENLGWIRFFSCTVSSIIYGNFFINKYGFLHKTERLTWEYQWGLRFVNC